jgi:hypothetical protein
MFSTFTNICNKKTRRLTLFELFTTPTKNWKKFSLTTKDVRCVHHGWHDTHRYDFEVLASLASSWVQLCVPCHSWCIHRISLIVNFFFSFPVAVNNSVPVGPLVFSLQIFVITQNIMKRPVFLFHFPTPS